MQSANSVSTVRGKTTLGQINDGRKVLTAIKDTKSEKAAAKKTALAKKAEQHEKKKAQQDKKDAKLEEKKVLQAKKEAQQEKAVDGMSKSKQASLGALKRKLGDREDDVRDNCCFGDCEIRFSRDSDHSWSDCANHHRCNYSVCDRHDALGSAAMDQHEKECRARHNHSWKAFGNGAQLPTKRRSALRKEDS